VCRKGEKRGAYRNDVRQLGEGSRVLRVDGRPQREHRRDDGGGVVSNEGIEGGGQEGCGLAPEGEVERVAGAGGGFRELDEVAVVVVLVVCKTVT
jgi:hypothetical protein